MLSSVGWIRERRIQRERRACMQLELFPADSKRRKEPEPLNRLSKAERAVVVATLARLMAKTLRREARRNNDER